MKLVLFFLILSLFVQNSLQAQLTPVAKSRGLGKHSVQTLAVGQNHTCALLDNGYVKCWGENLYGQLGLGDVNDRGDVAGEMGDKLPFVNLGTNRTARSLVAGAGHTCAILDNGTAKCWGENDEGELGLGDVNFRGDGAGEMGDSLPVVDLGTNRTARSMTGGRSHTCAILDNGTLKCWGRNTTGALGLEDAAHRGDGANEMGDNLPAVNLGTNRTARSLASGAHHNCAILDNGTAKCWGYNQNGQLGQGNTSQRGTSVGSMGDSMPVLDLGTNRSARSLTSGRHYANCAILDNGSVKCWGYNLNGRLGLGDTANRGDAGSEMGDSLQVVGLGVGLGKSKNKISTETLKPLGDNSPELFHETGQRHSSTFSMNIGHSCAILDNGGLKCWGANTYGQLGLGNTTARGDETGEMGDSLPLVSLGTNRTAKSIGVGSEHTCALLDNGSVKCWGRNNRGQLGLGDIANRGDAGGEMGDSLPVVNLGTNRSARSIFVGVEHTCAILDDGSVKCWGANGVGQLGLGDAAHRGDAGGEMGDSLPAVNLGTNRSARTLTSGANHICAILDNGTVKCWGYNFSGQLGLGDTAYRGDAGGEMGDSLPAVNLGTNRSARSLTTGLSHTCALLDNGTVKCWGGNMNGQLGLGDMASRGDAGGEMGDSLPATNLGTNRSARSLVCGGGYHNCAVLDDGSVKCWGQGGYGQLGLGDALDRGSSAGEMGDSLPAVNLGTNRSATSLVLGFGHTCAILDNGSVKCWGYNFDGELGLGDGIDRGAAAGEMGDALRAIRFGR